MTARELVERHVSGVNGERSLAARARAGRWTELLRRFPDLSSMRVLDLGGVPGQWIGHPVRPAQVVSVNLEGHPPVPESWVVSVRGDACDLPSQLANERFDLVYSNSVLEHVGGHARRWAFAETVHSVGAHHWIQTPYRYFPIEPHWLFPGFQFLPAHLRVALSHRWPLGHVRSPDRSAALVDVTGVELLSRTEMVGYFPQSEIWPERFGGLTKSLVAIR